MQALLLWVGQQRAVSLSALSSRYRLVIDLGDLQPADPEGGWASWQRAPQAGVLSPNDVRRKAGPRRTTRPPTASSRRLRAASRRARAPTTCCRRTPRRPTILLRWRCLTSTEAAMPELPDLNSPELALIKSRLARAHLGHKANIGAAHATDQDILDHVDDITALMLGALARAMAERRHTWLLHYGWFVDLVNELLEDEPGKPLDG
jgi:hypothetical protein